MSEPEAKKVGGTNRFGGMPGAPLRTFARKVLNLGSLIRSLAYSEIPDYTTRVGNTIVSCYGFRPRVTIGRGTYGRIKVYSHRPETELTIGSYSSLATPEILLAAEHHRDLSTYPFDDELVVKSSPVGDKVVIGNDVWIGHQALVLSGVKINDGAIVGARSVVTSDLPAYSISVGSPCRVISFRFDADTINRLLAIKWWDWPERLITANKTLFYSADLDRLESVARNLHIAESKVGIQTPEETRLLHEG